MGADLNPSFYHIFNNFSCGFRRIGFEFGSNPRFAARVAVRFALGFITRFVPGFRSFVLLGGALSGLLVVTFPNTVCAQEDETTFSGPVGTLFGRSQGVVEAPSSSVKAPRPFGAIGVDDALRSDRVVPAEGSEGGDTVPNPFADSGTDSGKTGAGGVDRFLRGSSDAGAAAFDPAEWGAPGQSVKTFRESSDQEIELSFPLESSGSFKRKAVLPGPRREEAPPADPGATASPDNGYRILWRELVEGGDPKEVLFWLRAGVNPNFADSRGFTLLMVACAYQADREAIRLLLDAGARANAVNVAGYTALAYAARFHEDAEVVRALIHAGANPNLSLNSGETPLMLVARYGTNPEVGSVLLDAGAGFEQRDIYGWSAPELARRRYEFRGSDFFRRMTLHLLRVRQKPRYSGWDDTYVGPNDGASETAIGPK